MSIEPFQISPRMVSAKDYLITARQLHAFGSDEMAAQHNWYGGMLAMARSLELVQTALTIMHGHVSGMSAADLREGRPLSDESALRMIERAIGKVHEHPNAMPGMIPPSRQYGEQDLLRASLHVERSLQAAVGSYPYFEAAKEHEITHHRTSELAFDPHAVTRF